MEYVKKEVNGFTLHLLKTNKFKSNHISVRFRSEFQKENCTKKNLIPHILKAATKKYPSRKLVNQKLDSLYGGSIGVGNKRIGKNNIIAFTLSLPNEKFLHNDVNLLENGLEFLYEIIHHPNCKNNLFNDQIIEEEKRFLKSHFESEYDDKMRYSFNQLIQHMFPNELYAVRPQGIYEEIDSITNQQLYSEYLDMISNDTIDILALGDFDFKEMEEKITTFFSFTKRNFYNAPIDYETKNIINHNEFFQIQNINQSKLTIGYRTNILFDDKYYLPMLLVNGILGGYIHSKLFQIVREQHSLCYYASSSYDGSKGVLFIYSGIDHANYHKTVNLITEIIEDLKMGNITEEELSLTKKCIINDMLETSDNPISNIGRAYNYHLLNKEFDVQKRIKLIDTISMKECIEAAKKITLDTLFFLSNEEVK